MRVYVTCLPRVAGTVQVKFSGRTIEEQDFYDRFYRAVRATLALGVPPPKQRQ